jgi:hypothetical protein
MKMKIGIYGQAAILAQRFCVRGMAPEEAWDTAMAQLSTSRWTQQEGCPKGAFLGLCEEGLIQGISAGSYTRSRDNKRYAIEAITLLREDPSLVTRKDAKKRLWESVAKGIAHHQQMDIVISLFKGGLVNHVAG